jgi:hypothetical protein
MKEWGVDWSGWEQVLVQWAVGFLKEMEVLDYLSNYQLPKEDLCYVQLSDWHATSTFSFLRPVLNVLEFHWNPRILLFYYERSDI